MIYIILIYIFIVVICFLYIKKNTQIKESPDCIVILSASINSFTQQRLNKAIHLATKSKNLKIIACGKEKSIFMENYLKNKSFHNYIIQNNSTNTYEDALYVQDIINKLNLKSIALVTSPTHQRRSYNTFKRVININIENFPTNLFFSIDSILLPLGWYGVLINIIKDKKYNGKLF
jgi:uncharacterized SAM-binding protein YcdF (DUF218 family)